MLIKYAFDKRNKNVFLDSKYEKDRMIVKEYYDMPYPRGLHDVGLYELVDYMSGLCQRFIEYPCNNLSWHLDVFRGSNREIIEQKILLYNYDDLNEYYKKMLVSLRILKKYYNEDGTLKDNNPFKINDEVSE